MSEPRRLGAAATEQLADARTLLDAASHNVQAALRAGAAGDALDTALAMAEQALAALRRVRERGG